MKQQTQNTKQAQSQTGRGIEDATAGSRTLIRWNPIFINTPPLPEGREPLSDYWRRPGGGREGPPGRARSPGTMQTKFPDSPPVGVNYNEYQTFNNKQKTNFFNNHFFKFLNFIIMKKQILILAFLVLAVFAGVNQSYGQLLPDLTIAPAGCPTPTLISCLTAASPLTPIPGNPYDYEVTVAVPGGGTFTYDWFITNDKNLIVGKVPKSPVPAFYSSHIAAVGSGAGLSAYHDATGTAKINITWQSFVPDPLNPVFLVIYVNNTLTCLTNNIQVYKIEPQPAFTLDVVNLTATGAAALDGVKTCVAPIVSATWIADKIVMDYGEDYLFYAVTAANFTHSWKPAFKAATSTALGTSTMDVAWAYPAKSFVGSTPVWNATVLNAGVWESATVVDAKTPLNGSIGSAGECIIVRVHVKWVNEPNEADNTVSFAVDGIMKDPAVVTADYTNVALGDLNASNAVPANCGKPDAFDNDKTTQIITARPAITSVPATVPFIIRTN